ncbi:hypothetical protein CHCC10893_0130 [Bacillus licheniformis]|nr:hypothetical protein CHCC10893_0130 [Bacillus licheniformis]
MLYGAAAGKFLKKKGGRQKTVKHVGSKLQYTYKKRDLISGPTPL